MRDDRAEFEALDTIGLIVDDTNDSDEDKIADIADVLAKLDGHRKAAGKPTIRDACARPTRTKQ